MLTNFDFNITKSSKNCIRNVGFLTLYKNLKCQQNLIIFSKQFSWFKKKYIKCCERRSSDLPRRMLLVLDTIATTSYANRFSWTQFVQGYKTWFIIMIQTLKLVVVGPLGVPNLFIFSSSFSSTKKKNKKQKKLQHFILWFFQSGKTTISNLLAEATELSSEYHPTEGVRILEFESDEVIVKQRPIKIDIELWDCSGNAKYSFKFYVLYYLIGKNTFRSLCLFITVKT